MTALDSDAELAQRAAKGEDRAFTALMRRHKSGVHGFAWRHVGDPDIAFEIVQETFVAAWKALARYDVQRPFATWLRAIALNKCRDHGRKVLVRRLILGDRSLDNPAAQAVPDGSPDPEETLLASRERTRLANAIARLPASLKEPLILTCFEDYSQQAAAELLGVSVKTIETRIYRARRKLADWLAAN